MVPEGLLYHTEHEWIRIENGEAVLGITHFAQDSLGDIVYIELPKVGTEVGLGQEIAEVESTKTASPIYSPISGTILSINEDLKDKPEQINQDPYGQGWIARIRVANADDAKGLMDAEKYGAYLKTLAD